MADMDLKQHAYEWFRMKGYSDQQAAALAGHMIAESGGNPRATHDSGTGVGIYGFRDPEQGKGRKTDLMKYAADNNLDPYALNTQLDFTHHELTGSEKAAGDRLRAAKDFKGANDAMMSYLRPQGYTADNPGGGHNYAGRWNAGASLIGAQPMMGPTMAAAGGSQQPTGGLLQAQPTGIDAEIAQWSGMEPPGGRAALNKVVAADAAKSANAYAAAGAAASKMGQEMVASGAPKQQQWENLQASVHQPQQLAQMPNLMGGGDFQQQLAQSRLGSFAPQKKRSPFDEEFG